MNSLKKIFLFCAFTFTAFQFNAQNRKLDKLEQLYAQQHYTLVFKKSSKLLELPEYDFTVLPKLYKSMSLFQLAKNEYWLKRNPTALADAEKLFLEMKNDAEGDKIMAAHMYEISSLKEDMYSWGEELQENGKKETLVELEKLLVRLFSKIPSINKTDTKSQPTIKTTKQTGTDQRSQIVAFAEKSIGVPYKWGGTTNNGFDCSGFTTYVMKEFDITMQRRAVDQYNGSTKLKQKSVQKGDLVFFNSGSGISHVGIIVSEMGEPLMMIHASSSQGITITNLETSAYWMKRLDSFGTYIQ